MEQQQSAFHARIVPADILRMSAESVRIEDKCVHGGVGGKFLDIDGTTSCEEIATIASNDAEGAALRREHAQPVHH
jgi:hypothetical protein